MDHGMTEDQPDKNRTSIDRRLREEYQKILREPIPENLKRLLAQLKDSDERPTFLKNVVGPIRSLRWTSPSSLGSR